METVWVEPGHAVGISGTTVIQVWESTGPDATRMRRILDVLTRLRSTGRHVQMLACIAETSPMPDAAARKIAASFPEYFDYYVGVHEGTSIRGALVRAVLLGTAMVSRVRARYEIFSTVDDGVRGLVAHGANDASELRRCVCELRERAVRWA